MYFLVYSRSHICAGKRACTHMAGQDVTDNDPSFSVHLEDIIQGDRNKPEGREGGQHGTVIC